MIRRIISWFTPRIKKPKVKTIVLTKVTKVDFSWDLDKTLRRMHNINFPKDRI